MNINAKTDALVQRFCLWLGRYGRWSNFLDRIAGVVCPTFLNPLLLPAEGGGLGLMHQPALMAGVRSTSPGARDTNPATPASPSPNGGDPGDPPHSLGECAAPIFQGMHGAPCAFHGGSSDNKWCPPGTTTGLWWRFNIAGIGNVYYVDCCGLAIKWKVWCRWAKEQNWCAGQGNNVYTCTITLLLSELHVGPNNFADPNMHVLVGPPAP